MDIDGFLMALDERGYDGSVTGKLYTYPDEPDTAARRTREVFVEDI